MVLIPTAPIRVQPYFGYRNAERLVLSARALRAHPPEFRRDARAHRLMGLRTMIAQFVSHEVAGLTVELEWRQEDGVLRSQSLVTDAEGFVHFDIALDPAWPPGAETRWDVVSLHWNDRRGTSASDLRIDGHVLAPGTDAGIAVISDIDDTIIETGITGGLRSVLRNWRRLLAQMPDERALVPGADAFYGAIGGGAVADPAYTEASHAGERLPATRHPFFYVSSSPWNLFSYLVAFQKTRKLPLGPLMLRDWGFDRATLGSAGHGAHKIAAIARIIETFPELRFALIGDDTQGDLPAFAEAAATHAGRVRAVFIRRAGEPFTPEEQAAKAALETAGVPLWLGESYETGQAFLRSIGLGHDGEAEEIVKAIDKTPAETTT